VPDYLADGLERVLSILTKVKSRNAVFELWVRRAWAVVAVRIMWNDIVDDENI
jgi:hypothetical protein